MAKRHFFNQLERVMFSCERPKTHLSHINDKKYDCYRTFYHF